MVKKGFSLAEALVVMVIISVFFAMAAKVITKRPKIKRQENFHGYYECYYDGSKWAQHYVRDGVESVLDSGTCSFEPPVGVVFFNINSIKPVTHSSYEPNINNKLSFAIDGSKITIKGGNATLDLEDNATEDEIKLFMNALYPESKIYNSGVSRPGIMISW